MVRLARVTALVLIAPFLTFASALAPQHVHESDAGPHHAVAHSHFGPHDTALHESHTTEIEHNDVEHVVWLDSAMLHASIHTATHVPPALSVCYETVPPASRWFVVLFDQAPPAHGPPKHSSCLRGPPFFV